MCVRMCNLGASSLICNTTARNATHALMSTDPDHCFGALTPFHNVSTTPISTPPVPGLWNNITLPGLQKWWLLLVLLNDLRNNLFYKMLRTVWTPSETTCWQRRKASASCQHDPTFPYFSIPTFQAYNNKQPKDTKGYQRKLKQAETLQWRRCITLDFKVFLCLDTKFLPFLKTGCSRFVLCGFLLCPNFSELSLIPSQTGPSYVHCSLLYKKPQKTCTTKWEGQLKLLQNAFLDSFVGMFYPDMGQS